MRGDTNVEPDDLAELFCSSDLSATSRRAAFEAIVSSLIEGDLPSRESVLRLIEFAAGRIDRTDYR